jgi:pyruvate dehydrogenase E1 component beta subunit
MTERELTYPQAQNEAFHQEMARDENVIIVGLDVAAPGGYVIAGARFGKFAWLVERFGRDRVRDTPISEPAFLGTCVGAAVTGLRPVVDMLHVDYIGLWLDQIGNSAAKLHYKSGGKIKVPLTVIASIGATGGTSCHHGQTHYSILAHIPGLKCVAPSDPYTVKGLTAAAIRDDDPVIIFDHKRLMPTKGTVPEEEYTVPIGQSRIVRDGKDVTLVGVSFMTQVCLEAADQLSKEGIEAEVLDLLSIYPMDEEAILNSIGKTGHLVIVDEDTPHCSVATEVAALVADKAFRSLKAPVRRVTPPHTPVPYARSLERAYAPDAQRVVQTVGALLQ